MIGIYLVMRVNFIIVVSIYQIWFILTQWLHTTLLLMYPIITMFSIYYWICVYSFFRKLIDERHQTIPMDIQARESTDITNI